MYKNFKTRTKILIGFLLMLVMLLVIVIFSLLEINTLSDELSVYPDRMLPNVSSVWSLRRDIASTQRYVLRAIASSDPVEIKEAVDAASEDGDHIQQTLESYKTTATADPALIEKLETTLAETRKAREELAPHILANTAEEDVIAFEYYDTVYKPVSDSAAEIAVELYDDQIAFAKERVAEAQRIEKGCFTLNIVLSIVSIIVAIVISIVSARVITAPIHDIEAVVSKMAVGDFSSEITYVSNDEIGQLAANCSKMEHTVTTIVRDMGEMLSTLAKGDFTVRSSYEGAYIGEYNPLIKDMYTLINSLSDTLSQINQSADQVANGSEQVSIGAQSLSQGSVEQASSVQELSATISDISGKIKLTSENAQLAKKLSGDSSESLEVSKKKMGEMISAMNDISSSSNEINKIIKTIDDIAFQTNILSLNAAVEAARAGAAGKGFAVVADEVRTLAQKSAEAVQSTTTMIESTIEAVANGTKIVDATAESIFDVVERTKKVVDVIDNIAADAEEQADAISQITVGIDQISSVVQTNSATSEESAAASEELSGQADGLKTLISSFRLGGSRR